AEAAKPLDARKLQFGCARDVHMASENSTTRNPKSDWCARTSASHFIGYGRLETLRRICSIQTLITRSTFSHKVEVDSPRLDRCEPNNSIDSQKLFMGRSLYKQCGGLSIPRSEDNVAITTCFGL